MSRPRKRRFSTTVLFITVFLAVFLFAMDLGGFLSPVRNISDTVFNPVRFWFYRQGRVASTFFRDLSSISSLREENVELKAKVFDLETLVSESTELERENDVLRKQLNLPIEDEKELIPADIVGGDLKALNVETMIVNKGEESGVKEGSVATYAGYLVGQVTKVGKFSSEIQLLTSGGTSVPAISEKHRTKGIVTGDVNTGISMTRILREEIVEVGEKVLTSGMGTFPKGLIIGIIAGVEGSDADVEQKALIKEYLDVKSIEEVFIVNVRKD